MKKLSLLAGVAGIAMAGISTGNTNDLQNQSIHTVNGVVQFVSPTISAEDLGKMIFPTPMKKKVLTRSIFDNPETTPQNVPVTVAMLIQFEFDSAILTEESKTRLDTIGAMLNIDSPSVRRLVIEGHTDIVGSSEYNLGLSFRRAESVKKFLMSNHNIASNRLDISGKGESQLIDLDNPKGPVNRRVQFSAAPA